MLILFLWLADVVTKFSEIVGFMYFVVFVGSTAAYVFVKISAFERISYQDSLLDKTYILIEQKLDEVIENDKSN